MKIQTFLQQSSNIYAENRLLKFTVVCLSIAVIIISIFSYSALKYQRVVILPPVVDRRIEISGNSVNEDYVRLFARYAMTLLNDFTPGAAPGQFSELLTLSSPSFYPAFQKTLNGMKDTITKLNLTSVFYPQALSIDTEKKVIEVTGQQKHFAGAVMVDNGLKKYQITYVITDGRFFIDGLTEIASK
jgi:conjugal transfer pilus assembly protein TraE